MNQHILESGNLEITYHLIRCGEEGVCEEELLERFNRALVVGGSIVVPHLRRAIDMFDRLPAGAGGAGGHKGAGQPAAEPERETGP